MDKNKIIEQTAEFARKNLANESTGHDWWHTYRVWKMSLRIANEEKDAYLFVVQLAALLHDIADWKFNKGDESVGPKLAREWLEKLQLDENIISHVCEIIKEISFKGEAEKSKIKTKEGMIVQDADRLDALGAIGIARVFAFGGYRGNPIYDPNVKPIKNKTVEQYKRMNAPAINHFYEKLLLLKGLMNTKTGKKIAEGRHKIMEKFLEDFFKEWEVEG